MTEESKPDEAQIADPCIRLCVKDLNDDICLGCGRTRREIDDWQSLGRMQRLIILSKQDARLEMLAQKRRQNRGQRRQKKTPNITPHGKETD